MTDSKDKDDARHFKYVANGGMPCGDATHEHPATPPASGDVEAALRSVWATRLQAAETFDAAVVRLVAAIRGDSAGTLDGAIEALIRAMTRTPRWSESDARHDLMPVIEAAARLAEEPR